MGSARATRVDLPHDYTLASLIMSHSWYEKAIIYSIEVRSFKDSDGDGYGDLRGLTSQLDYLVRLGVNCIWLQPFYPSPDFDDGYDVSEYCDVDPRVGTLDDFAAFIREAKRRDIRVIIDLVVNHTSRQHPWFQAARRDRTSKYRNYYVWSEGPPEVERRGGPVFPGEQSTNWTYDSEAEGYYWHWFYEHQPDLNTGNPEVVEEIERIISFWLDRGVSGFRIDAATFLVKRKGVTGAQPADPDAFLTELRTYISKQASDAVLLAEADVPADELPLFLGAGDRMHLVFNFILNNYVFLALAREAAEPLIRGLESLPVCPRGSMWANFLRNHDELNLDKLTTSEQAEVFAAFAPISPMRIYGRGIRRRLPPMLAGERARIELAYSLLFAIPGIPVLRYGQEIGMGDDLALEGRRSVRTPMQWSAEQNGGFSTAATEELARPVIQGGQYGYEKLNVSSQRRDPSSLLNFMRRLIRARKNCPEIGAGTLSILDSGDPHVFAHRCDHEGRSVVAVHNLSNEHRVVSLRLRGERMKPRAELFSEAGVRPLPDDLDSVQLGPYGYRWFRLESPAFVTA